MTIIPADIPGWLVYVGIAALLLTHRFVLSTRKRALWGAVAPVLWVSVLTISAVQGRTQGVGDWARDLMVFLALVGMALLGRESSRKKEVRR